MSLVEVLSNAQNPNDLIRRAAEAHLVQAEETQYGPFLIALCTELASEDRPLNVRQMAGLHIKNLISAKNSAVMLQKEQRWKECDGATKDGARGAFLQALLSPQREVARVAAQIIASYGAVDVPLEQWPSLMDTLCSNVTRADMHETTKVASLEATGYMCEIMSDNGNMPKAPVVNQILMSIVDGMNAARPNPIRLAATTALKNSLVFTEENFKSEAERNMLMTTICEATQCADPAVRREAYECLAKVAELYYDDLQPYILTIFKLTTEAIATDVEEVAIVAIEFWATVCEVEQDRLSDISDGFEATKMSNLIENAVVPLTQAMLQTMTRQPEQVSEDDWNISEAGAVCLKEMAETLGPKVMPHVLPFVQQHIQSPQWNLRDAAVSAFGVILTEGSREQMTDAVNSALPVLLGLAQDPHPRVRASAVWTLATVCLFNKTSTDPLILQLVQAFVHLLKDPESSIANMACLGINNLALACGEVEDRMRESQGLPRTAPADTNVMSAPYYDLVKVLLEAANRPDDGGPTSVRMAAYETINSLVEKSAADVHGINKAILEEALTRLEAICADSAMAPKDRHDMQCRICSLVGSVVKKLSAADVPVAPLGDRIMALLLGILQTGKGIAGNDDAGYAVGGMMECLEDGFIRYAVHLKPILMQGMCQHDDKDTCIITVGLLGDLCRAIKKEVYGNEPPHCDEFVQCLMQLCMSNDVDRQVKPIVIAIFADLAMAIEGGFQRYSETVLPVLRMAGQIEITPDMGEEDIEYINELRSAILEAYTGILQGLKSANAEDTVGGHVSDIIQFLRRVAVDDNKSEEVLKNLVGLLGDLANVYKGKIVPHISDGAFVNLIVTTCKDDDDSMVELAQWAFTELQLIGVVQAPGAYGLPAFPNP